MWMQALYAGLIIAGFAAFYKENFLTFLWMMIKLYLLLWIPTTLIAAVIMKEQNIFLRLIVSLGATVAMVGLMNYFLGMFGIGVMHQSMIVVPAMIVLAVVFNLGAGWGEGRKKN